MTKKLPLLVVAVALAAALVGVFVWPGEAQQSRTMQDGAVNAVAPIQVIANNAHIDAGMRIIHVPEAGEIAAYPRSSGRTTREDARPKADTPRVAMPKPPQPRRILAPPAIEPKRSVLSAPPPAAESLTPIRPTPRWTTTEKFTAPPERQPQADAAPATSSPTDAVAMPSQPDTVSEIDEDAPPPAD